MFVFVKLQIWVQLKFLKIKAARIVKMAFEFPKYQNLISREIQVDGSKCLEFFTLWYSAPNLFYNLPHQ